jgi:hypothetical protein
VGRGTAFIPYSSGIRTGHWPLLATGGWWPVSGQWVWAAWQLAAGSWQAPGIWHLAYPLATGHYWLLVVAGGQSVSGQWVWAAWHLAPGSWQAPGIWHLAYRISTSSHWPLATTGYWWLAVAGGWWPVSGQWVWVECVRAIQTRLPALGPPPPEFC